MPLSRSTYDDMVATSLLNHVRNEFSGNRRSALIFFVLTCVREERNDRCDALSARNFAGMDHDAELHESCVHCTTASVDDIDIVLSHRFGDPDVRFADTTLSDFSLGKGQTNAAA